MPRALAALVLLAACEPEPVVELCCPPPTPEQPWCDGPQIDGARLEAGVTARGTHLIVLGGFVSPALDVTREVLALDTLAVRWLREPDAPVAWTHANIATSVATLFLLGGLEQPEFMARGEAYALDDNATTWREVPPLPIPRGAAAVVAAPGHIFLLGGAVSGGGATASCLDFDVAHETWRELPDLPLARSHAAAMRRYDGTLIVAGGLSEAGMPLGDVWSLAPNATAWQPRAAMPTNRGGCAHGVALGQLICAGGEAGPAVLSVVESYNPNTDEWTSWPDMPEPRAGSQGAAIGQRLYVPGGSATRLFAPTSSVLELSMLDALAR